MGNGVHAFMIAESNAFSFTVSQTPLAGIIIAVLLMLMSTLGWAIMRTKFSLLRRAEAQNETFLQKFRDSESPLELFESETEVPGAPLYAVYRAAAKELAYSTMGDEERPRAIDPNRGSKVSIAPSQMRGIRASMDRAVGEAALRIENRLPILGGIVSVGPFIGLLGTVWGVVIAFADTAMAGGQASLQTMSPGISAALITTLIGLLVAIPAVFGYNYLMARIRRMIVQLDNFSSEFASAIDRLYVDHLGLRGSSRPSLLGMGDPINERFANMRRSDLGGSAARELREPTEED